MTLIVFDLDGTLIDSAKDLAISMNATREHLNLQPLDPHLIYSFVGNGAAMLVKRALGAEAAATTGITRQPGTARSVMTRLTRPAGWPRGRPRA